MWLPENIKSVPGNVAAAVLQRRAARSHLLTQWSEASAATSATATRGPSGAGQASP